MKDIKVAAPIANDFLTRRMKAMAELNILNCILEDRITYIVELVCKVCKRKFVDWYYPNISDDEFGNFDSATFTKGRYGDSIKLEIEIGSNYNRNILTDVIILKNGEECNLSEIPTRWLVEDFEGELINGRKAYLEKILHDKKINHERKNKKLSKEKAIIASIENKLTSEELKFIKQKIIKTRI